MLYNNRNCSVPAAFFSPFLRFKDHNINLYAYYTLRIHLVRSRLWIHAEACTVPNFQVIFFFYYKLRRYQLSRVGIAKRINYFTLRQY